MARARLRPSEALWLGLLHGPAELVPVSSSGHLTVVPFLAGWDYNRVDPDLRKAFEVALHAGTYAGMAAALREPMLAAVRELLPGRARAGAGGRERTGSGAGGAGSRGEPLRVAGIVLAAFLPPGAVGYLLEGPIERRFGTPGSVALGLIAGGAALAWADARAPATRGFDDATVVDGAWLGVGQAAALMPGISRNGATLTAARLRGFRRADANRLSWHVAAPVIAAASGLKLVRLAARGLPGEALVPFGIGATASFASTYVSGAIVQRVGSSRTLVPYGLYRVALGGTVLTKLRRSRTMGS